MRNQIAAANWKMNLTLTEALKLTDELLSTPYNLQDHHQVILGVPFPYIIPVQQKLKEKRNIFVAAQNCSSKNSGAYTGEVSVQMLQSLDVKYIIIGHSERREYFQESNSLLAEKIDRALETGSKPIFCCGEPLDIREGGNQNNYVESQLKESLFHLSKMQMQNFIVAYEPIWAIGTGKTATSIQAQEMHSHIRNVLANQYGEVAESISILYGGSVKAANASEIFSQPDVDGGLVGGASLNASEFSTIIKSLKNY